MPTTMCTNMRISVTKFCASIITKCVNLQELELKSKRAVWNRCDMKIQCTRISVVVSKYIFFDSNILTHNIMQKSARIIENLIHSLEINRSRPNFLILFSLLLIFIFYFRSLFSVNLIFSIPGIPIVTYSSLFPSGSQNKSNPALCQDIRVQNLHQRN